MNSYTPATDRHTVEPEKPAPLQTLAGAVGGTRYLPLPTLVADLRSDHAGESGAVMIYRGILAITRDAGVRHFAQQHLAAEARHLSQIEPLLAPQQPSRLLPLWHVAGWLTGALPARVGPRMVYATIEAVETFFDQHYAEQIESIDPHDPHSSHPPLQSVRALLQACRSDEIAHRDEAPALFAAGGRPASLALRCWVWSVGAGSRVAVKICRGI
ncbi:MAG: demethoxyubiquinone hydroxylase family protein [Sterolibacteriaceae bacterium]|uniref:Demethoxyubiquinone hydroxylase family protein n=1 Tax=Candidatus Methylophosphatis roskildensis TaxID=2899263 RepID=A0A9D7E8Z3_9PROT|nr:demethoxyubiquinone hydroxylase family protein [Candidatus Methylophosphatis roskildensis]MBK7237305.1 demethoxyubiquinone hydroxylase family protein [Sterolibacteriaceae bacterium]